MEKSGLGCLDLRVAGLGISRSDSKQRMAVPTLTNREAMTACSPMRKRGVKQYKKLSRETATEHGGHKMTR